MGEDGRESDLNPNIERRNDDKAKAKRAEKRKNFLTDEQWDALEEDFHANLFDHQRLWWDNRHQRTRKIKKSRQVGASWYFAREAMMKIRERSEEHTSELQSLMRISYAVFCLKKTQNQKNDKSKLDQPKIDIHD